MRPIRFGEPGRERPGLQLANGVLVDASTAGGDDEAFVEDGVLDRLVNVSRQDNATTNMIFDVVCQKVVDSA